jgi:plasmid maintenance system antidote protein VapI
MSAEFWLGLQTAYDLEVARQEVGTFEQIVPHAA